jgi:hypothetical protein
MADRPIDDRPAAGIEIAPRAMTDGSGGDSIAGGLPPVTSPVSSPGAKLDRDAGLWLNGDVLACACPECGAPMTIRLWLMVADCWRCGTSIELTEEQEAAARRLLERRTADARNTEPVATTAPTRARTAAPQPAERKSDPTKPSRPAAPASPAPASPSKSEPRRHTAPSTKPQPTPSPATAPKPPRTTARELTPIAPPIAAAKRKRSWLDRLLRQMPAWLASLIVHLLVLILLSLLGIDRQQQPISLVLSTTIGPERREGGDPTITANNPDPEFDLPFNTPLDGKPREVVLQAHEDAKRLQLDPTAARRMPHIEATKKLLHSNSPHERTFAGRDPRLRAEVLQHEGGTLWTEAAVARGLHWLAQHQSPNGSWSLSRFHNHPNCRGRCDESGSVPGEMAGTSLALLPFLGAGQSPNAPGIYRDVTARGLQWLLQQQDPQTGDLRGDADTKSGMYVHGQATIVLCEAYSLTGNEALREPCRKAIEFIEAAQHVRGGWRYQPGEPGDTSVHGWQVMALYSGRTATVEVPSHVLLLANQFLDSVASRDRPGIYGYRPRERETPAMTAEALLCRFYLGARIDDPGIRAGVQHLIDEHLPNEDYVDLYYWYYGTQVMHHVGGEAWDRWNRRMSDLLITTQRTDGHEAGSWDPRTRYDYAAGRIYTTALATCTLEVYYRHTPIFRKIQLD